MSRFSERLQPAVKAETKWVAAYTAAGIVLMWIGFAVLHTVMPGKIPFDYTVILGGIGGGVIAVLNFLFMGLTVQKVAAAEEEAAARNMMKASYSQRTLIQMLWVIAAILAPCFQFVAGILPLLFPGAGIKLMGIIGRK